MIYQQGQKVRIRPDLKEGHDYDNYVNEVMIGYAGDVVTLVRKASNNWVIKEDGHMWRWTQDMFSPVSHTPDEAFQLYLKGHITEKGYNDLIREGSSTS